MEHFRLQHKVVWESGEYARRELEARDRMVRQLSETGLDSGEAEEIMVWSSSGKGQLSGRKTCWNGNRLGFACRQCYCQEVKVEVKYHVKLRMPHEIFY